MRNRSRHPNQFIVSAPSAVSASDLAARLTASPMVLWAEVDCLHESRKKLLPNDTGFANQWYLYNIGHTSGMTNRDVCAEKAWDITQGTSSVVIAILDDGFQLNHPDLAANIFSNALEGTPGVDGDGNGYTNDWRGWDFVGNDNDPSPADADDNHGTTMAGIAVAVASNILGIAGLANRCRLLPIRIAGAGLPASDWADAIEYAAGTADVISISYYLQPSSVIYDALNYALVNGRGGLGCVVCTALGNDGVMRRYTSDATAAPAVLSVSGSSNYDRRPWFADYGPAVNLVCPAGGGSYSLYTTDRTGADGYSADNYVYRGDSGTSPSCPMAAAAAALIITEHPSWTGLEVRQMLEASCDRIDAVAHPYNDRGWNERYGFGRVNAWAALATPQPAWDTYESDDTADSAALIEDGELQYRSLNSINDLDWVRIVMTSQTDLRLTILGTTNAYLRLYDSQTNQIAVDDAGFPSYSRLTTNGLGAGTYYARVESPNSVPVGHYGLHLGLLNMSDAYESDWDRLSSKPIAPREMQYRTLYPAGDEDWATFALTTSATVEVSTMGEWDGYIELSLFNTGGPAPIAYSYNTNATASISTQLSAGTYYVKVDDYGDYAVSSYQLLLETYAVDEYEPDNTNTQAAAIDSGERALHTLFPANDADWLTFALDCRANVLIMTDTINPYLVGDTTLILYKESGGLQPVATNYDGNNEYFSAIYQTELDPGTYYIEVSGKTNDTICPDYYVALDIFEKPARIENVDLRTNGFEFSWSADAAFFYQIQYTNDLTDTQEWTVATNNIEGRVGRMDWVDSGWSSASQRFYRIVTQ